ncbi:hypothetical protein AVEN_140864-1 [Araneus ventricosus]|uniref:Tc3 transposase DNA binding domain-containing protein n=1 Tax=Araneus ventricosus TaxID=182803 RepID=A0A4Y2T7I2_ARAVE|nr:hypothetical protein AVEN_187683-1 [Araneus ventricosus]GBN95448.1 hypothetical protein AVEN_253395-1 [Araneus ventricosus]GBO09173.1 hypothetical protein AVEN_252055-1 [Araneus ventricosus]GBO09208.1 hypothetical protein AVEN_140864-1 [Araneus ventricosus]
MPRGISLTEFQKGQAIAYINDGKTILEITGILKISKSAISEFLKNPDAHRKREKTGRPRKLTPKEQRNLLRQLKKRGASIPTVQRESGLTHITRQIAFNYVQRTKQFQFKKRKHHPKWTKNILLIDWRGVKSTCPGPLNGHPLFSLMRKGSI